MARNFTLKESEAKVIQVVAGCSGKTPEYIASHMAESLSVSGNYAIVLCLNEDLGVTIPDTIIEADTTSTRSLVVAAQNLLRQEGRLIENTIGNKPSHQNGRIRPRTDRYR